MSDSEQQKHKIIQDPICGYKRLENLPDQKELDEYYRSKYYDSISEDGSAAEQRRLIAGGDEEAEERKWLNATLYSDISFLLDLHSAGKDILDVGCGSGDLMGFLSQNGFKTVGIEPSLKAFESAKSKGLTVYKQTLEEFINYNRLNSKKKYDVVTLIHFLEHVVDPIATINHTKQFLKAKGLICIRVPNDFNDLQCAAREKIKKDNWWVSPPAHINYFNFQSLEKVLRCLGFEVIYSQGDFPTELFLLMGEDYVGSPDIGTKCHRKRIDFEMALSAELRRKIYSSLAKIGIGRNCLMIGRLKEQ